MVEFDNLCETVEELVSLSTQLDSNPKKDRKGGFFRYISGSENYASFSRSYASSIGEATKENMKIYQKLSSEKAHRMFAHWLRSPKKEEVYSSWQTRDVDDRMYGGGILINNLEKSSCDILTFSGLDEHIDESVVVVAGVKHNILDISAANQILKFSYNMSCKELFNKFNS